MTGLSAWGLTGLLLCAALALAVVLGALVLLFAGYVGYLQLQYYRIEDNLALEVASAPAETLAAGGEYTAVTCNLGFGAYGPDYSFFMDTGVMEDGTPTQGLYGKARSEEDVLANTTAALNALEGLDADLLLLQEVDYDSHRSYFVDQRQMALDAFSDYGWIWGQNFHSGYLAYPLTDHHGVVNAGLPCQFKGKTSSQTGACTRHYGITSDEGRHAGSYGFIARIIRFPVHQFHCANRLFVTDMTCPDGFHTIVQKVSYSSVNHPDPVRIVVPEGYGQPFPAPVPSLHCHWHIFPAVCPGPEGASDFPDPASFIAVPEIGMGVELHHAEGAETFLQGRHFSVGEGMFPAEHHGHGARIQCGEHGQTHSVHDFFRGAGTVHGLLGENALFSGKARAVVQFQLIGGVKNGFRAVRRAARIAYRGFIGHGDDVKARLACGAGAVTKLKQPGTDHLERVFNYKFPYEYNAGLEEMLARKEQVKAFYEKYGAKTDSAARADQ